MLARMAYVSRAQLAAQTSMLVAGVIQQTLGDRMVLAEVVAAGPYAWRVGFARTFAGLPVDADMADRAYRYLAAQHIERSGGVSAGAVLDAHAPPSPPTEREIARSWEVESHSSEEGRRALYGVDGHPQALLDRMASEE